MKKGFTLIELLAVIVILAIIAVIATPIVLNIINESRESVALRNAESYFKAVELSMVSNQMNNIQKEDDILRIMEDGNICTGVLSNSKTCVGQILKVEVDGDRPNSGTIIFKNKKIHKILSLTYSGNNVVINKLDEKNFVVINEYDIWDGKSSTELNKLSINETTKVVEINSAADLAGFRDAVNEGNLHGYTANLNVNIDLSNKNWIPIGIKTTDSFATNYVGTFNGNGYTIKGININQTTDLAGFFGRVAGEENVIINNLTIEGSSISGGKSAGGLIAYVDYNENVKPDVIINNVISNMYVESKDAAAGFIGRSYSYGNTYITNSINNGEIKSTNPETARGKLAGFVGIHADGPLIVKNCVNNGNASGGTYASGILSYLDSEAIVMIENSINNGNMTSLSSTNSASRNTVSAGIVGSIAYYYSQYDAGTIKNCINNGAIESSSKSGGIGGLIINMNIIDSTNNGNVLVTETTDSNHNGAGGIIGLAKQSFTVENSVNNGAVTGTVAVGGVIGMANMYSINFNEPYNARFKIINSNGGTKAITTTSTGMIGRVVGQIVLPEQYKGTANEVVQTIIGTDKNPGDTIQAIGGTRYTW